MNRNGELGPKPDRNTRFMQRDGYWYYSTREGIDIGPFDNLQEAQAGVSAFIDFILHAEPEVVESINRYYSAA